MAVWNETTKMEISATRRIDAEFSQPHYVKAEKRTRLCKIDNLGKLGSFIPGPFGSAFRVRNYDFQSPYRYIRGQDVKPFFILDEDCRFIPETDFVRLKRYAVKKDDVMISVVGTLGNVAVCTERETPAMFSCKSTLFRTSGIDPYYLLAYLNSPSGQLCLLRRQRGAIQMGLNIEDLRSMPVPRLKAREERTISESVRRAHSLLITAKAMYQSCQQILVSELGMDKLKFRRPVSYTAQFSEVETTRRFDSEHFYPAFDHWVSKLKRTIKLSRLTEHLNFCQRGKQPRYCADGLPVINSKHVLANQVVFSGNRRGTLGMKPEMEIGFEDLLVNGTGRGTIGRAAPYLEKTNALPDNHVTILRTKEIDPVYLSYYMNSAAGQMQVEMHQRGSSGQLELYPFDIRRFLVWEAPQELQDEIRQLHERATFAEQESKRLLEEAKTSVEKFIEEAVKS